MAEFTIYYGDGTTRSGTKKADWVKAPNTNVQVVVEWRTPSVTERPWTLVLDRYIWTGDETYDPFGYGAKSGALIFDQQYTAIWQSAFWEPKP